MTNNERDSRAVGGERTPELRDNEPGRPKARRGFARMDPARQREIASKGGRASHARGTGHEWDTNAAREAGRKGGLVSRGGRGRLVEPSTSAETTERATNAVATAGGAGEGGEPGAPTPRGVGAEPPSRDEGRDRRGEF